MEVEIVNNSNNPLPSYATEQSAGVDLRANLETSVLLEPGATAMIPTGLHIALPINYEAQVRPRSGLAAKHGITVLNSPGTIDADYRGEIKVILINHGKASFEITHGERVAQMVIAPVTQVSWKEEKTLNTTERGSGGFGHTGVQ